MGPNRNPHWSTSGLSVTLSYPVLPLSNNGDISIGGAYLTLLTNENKPYFPESFVRFDIFPLFINVVYASHVSFCDLLCNGEYTPTVDS